MGFKAGKQNLVALRNAEIEELKKQLNYERYVKPMLNTFAQRLGHALLVQLAHRSYKDWPQFAKETFAWVANEMPVAAQTYKDSLPKE